MAVLEIITLVVDGYGLQGFQSVEIQKSMQNGAMSFNMQASAPSWSDQAMALRNGQQIEIYSSPVDSGGLGGGGGLGDLIVTGAVDEYNAEYDGDSHTITLSGRSKGRDAIDCHPVKHQTGLVRNKTLLAAAQEFDEFGTNWSTDQQLQPIDTIQRRPEEPLFDTIERYARRGGFMLPAQPDGRHHDHPRRDQSACRRARPGPVARQEDERQNHDDAEALAGGGSRAAPVRRTGSSNLRQEYQDSGDDGDAHRPALIIAEGDHTDQDLQTRAKWERLRMAAYGIRIGATTSCWRDDGGMIWTPGYLMAIENDPEGVDGDFTLSTVTLRQTDGEGKGAGTHAEMEFVDPASHGSSSSSSGSSDSVFSSGGSL